MSSTADSESLAEISSGPVMPTGAVVMDAFKNFIRHGRHARNPQCVEPQIASQQHRVLPAPQQQQQQQAQPQQHVPPQQQNGQAYTREAEMIVKEEREAKSKMPVYSGLERFRVTDKMGDGAFSNVYKATEIQTSQNVAIKVVRKYELNAVQQDQKHLNPQFKKKPRVTERANILKEVQIMRGINHSSIVKLLSFSESEEHYFLVLELMEGGELFHQIVKLTYFSEALSRHVILQVARGIRYLHEERGVVHRDIKPENLLYQSIPIIPSKSVIHRPYDEDKEDEGEFIPGVGGGGIGHVKIADFGLSKVVWDEQTMTPCGTVGYTAPEIVKDERYSKSVDMWALGCVLYTLLCGFPPFYDESISVLTEKVARGQYTFLSPWWDDISNSSKDLISHLLCVDPAQRYSIDEFLAHPWCNEQPLPQITQLDLLHQGQALPLDSPLLQSVRGMNREGRSPGITTLKEAFDVTYAVHRMEEEGARRRAYKGPGGAGERGFLQGLDEDDEEDEDLLLVEKARQRDVASTETRAIPIPGRNGPGGADRRIAEDALYSGIRAGGPRNQDRRNRGFALDMDGATLLSRRHRRANPEPSPLSHQPIAPGDMVASIHRQ